MNQRYKIPRQSQEETQKSLYESVKSAICNWDTEVGRFGVGNRYFRERKYKKFWWHRPRPVFKCRHNLLDEVKSWPPSRRKILNSLIELSHKHKFVYIGQKALGKMVSCTRGVTNKQLRCLEEDGLVFNNYRHMQTSTYRIASLFQIKHIKRKLGKLLPALLLGLMVMVTQPCNISCSKLNNSIMSCKDTKLSYDSKSACLNVGHSLAKYRKSTRCCPPGFRPKGKRVMTKEEIAARVKAIEYVSLTLDLSRYGKARLSIFPEFALRDAHIKLIKSLKGKIVIKDPFAYLYDLANKASIELKLPLDYSLFDRYNFNGDEEPLLSDTITLPKPETKKGHKMYAAYRPWQKTPDNLDYVKEVRKYHQPEEIPGFNETMAKASSVFGKEFMKENFEAFKMRFTKKAIECVQ